MKTGLLFHILVTAYLWLIDLVPLGNWNYQQDQHLLPAIFAGKGIEAGDILFLLFVSLPSILFWIAYKKRNFWLGISTLILDTVWLIMQVLSWWLPYIFGTNKQWQLDYAKGPTTKILPSFGNHIAPDGMHFVIQLLLLLAITTGVIGVYQLRVIGKGV